MHERLQNLQTSEVTFAHVITPLTSFILLFILLLLTCFRCEEARAAPAMQETSRFIRSDGTVIKNMSNGDVIILYADGAVSKMTDVPSGQSILQRPETPRPSSAHSGREQTTATARKS